MKYVVKDEKNLVQHCAAGGAHTGEKVWDTVL